MTNFTVRWHADGMTASGPTRTFRDVRIPVAIKCKADFTPVSALRHFLLYGAPAGRRTTFGVVAEARKLACACSVICHYANQTGDDNNDVVQYSYDVRKKLLMYPIKLVSTRGTAMSL
jgi:hypothetical protein